ncbi:MAG: tyrosine-protein phosphatase [Panacagrimonas sp.]
MTADLSSPMQRRVVLSGAVNFRDLGGYPTVDGRRVKAGTVFRADQLADLSDADIEIVQGLGLRTICDLRGDSERERKPNREVPGTVVHAIGFIPQSALGLIAQVKSLTVEQVERWVSGIYRDFIVEGSAMFARLFERLLEGDAYPLLFHCTSGRDRTGTASALLLTALDVPRETVAADYDLSNLYRRDIAFQMGSGIDPVVMAAVTRAHPAYLARVFEVIEEGWGSADEYLRKALGLSATARERLKALLLEAPARQI